jgi:FkbM family methyltransferase
MAGCLPKAGASNDTSRPPNMDVHNENACPSICGYRVLATPPVFFQLAKRLLRSRVRGSFRLLTLVRCGTVVRYDLGDSHTLTVPVFREDNCWDMDDILSYEAKLLSETSRAAQGMQNATLVDCGADIGIFSVLLCRTTPPIRHVIAIEANAEVLPFLSCNLNALPHPAVMIGAAVGNLNGTGRLERAARDPSDRGLECSRFGEANAGIMTRMLLRYRPHHSMTNGAEIVCTFPRRHQVRDRTVLHRNRKRHSYGRRQGPSCTDQGRAAGWGISGLVKWRASALD